MNIEHTPLDFAINGGVGPECVKFHQHLADRIAFKSGDRYETFYRGYVVKFRSLLYGQVFCVLEEADLILLNRTLR